MPVGHGTVGHAGPSPADLGWYGRQGMAIFTCKTRAEEPARKEGNRVWWIVVVTRYNQNRNHSEKGSAWTIVKSPRACHTERVLSVNPTI